MEKGVEILKGFIRNSEFPPIKSSTITRCGCNSFLHSFSPVDWLCMIACLVVRGLVRVD